MRNILAPVLLVAALSVGAARAAVSATPPQQPGKPAGGQPAAAPAAAPASAAPASAPAVKASTPTVTPAMIYNVDRLRDPFMAASASAAPARPFSVKDDFNIHNLKLAGVMKDSGADYALLLDNTFGISFILRNGKLYDARNKVIPSVHGRLNLRLKRVELETDERDVQVLTLGEDAKD